MKFVTDDTGRLALSGAWTLVSVVVPTTANTSPAPALALALALALASALALALTSDFCLQKGDLRR